MSLIDVSGEFYVYLLISIPKFSEVFEKRDINTGKIAIS